MSDDVFNQNSFKVRLKNLFLNREGNTLFPVKMVIGAVLLSGLITISSYASFANATTNATTIDTNKIITGDTEEYRIFEGQEPTLQPSDVGLQTNPMPGTFEWWYFQGKLDDNSTTQITLLSKALG